MALAAASALMAVGCGNMRSEKQDLSFFRKHRPELETLVVALRACKAPVVTIYSRGEPHGQCASKDTELRAQVARLGLESASASQQQGGRSYIEFVTGSRGFGCRTAIVWTDDPSRIGPEEYDPLTVPPSKWWWLSLEVC
jgi:hypothetical protein